MRGSRKRHGRSLAEGCEAAPLEEFCNSLSSTFAESCDGYDDRFRGYDGGSTDDPFGVSVCRCTDDAGTVFDYAIANFFPYGARYFYDMDTGELVAVSTFSDVSLSPSCSALWYGRVIEGCGFWCPDDSQADVADAGP